MPPGSINDPYSNKPFKYHPNGLEHPIKLVSEKLIPAHTPLLRSVGSANWKLLETFEYDPNENRTANALLGDERPATGQTVFKFLPQERDGSYFENLIFTLPR